MNFARLPFPYDDPIVDPLPQPLIHVYVRKPIQLLLPFPRRRRRKSIQRLPAEPVQLNLNLQQGKVL